MLAFSDSVTVAIGVLMLVAIVLIISIIRYNADDFVKFWAAVGTMIGLALGGVGTFFFTKEQVENKESQLKTTQNALQTSEKEKTAAGQTLTQLVDSVTWDPGATSKIKQLSLQLKGEKPSSDIRSWDSPQMYASPAPSVSPPPSLSVSPARDLEPKAEARTSPTR
jgi:hypothetical protein